MTKLRAETLLKKSPKFNFSPTTISNELTQFKTNTKYKVKRIKRTYLKLAHANHAQVSFPYHQHKKAVSRVGKHRKWADLPTSSTPRKSNHEGQLDKPKSSYNWKKNPSSPLNRSRERERRKRQRKRRRLKT